MSFLNPLAFLFLFSLPLIFLFHLLRIRRQEATVSSTAFWAEAQRGEVTAKGTATIELPSKGA